MPKIQELATTVLLDCPWPEHGGGKIKRGADRHYDLIKKKEDILRVILQSGRWRVADDAHCLEWGLWLLGALGFTYKTNIVWVKVKKDWPDLKDLIAEDGGLDLNPITWLKTLAKAVRIGIGQYFRGSHEIILFGTRGKTMKPKKALPTVFHAPREEEEGKEKHSKKPTRSYEIIEATSPGSYFEFFARSRRKGWRSWGDEAKQ